MFKKCICNDCKKEFWTFKSASWWCEDCRKKYIRKEIHGGWGMKKEDFEFMKIDRTDGHIDYWFNVKGETRQELNRKYGSEQGFVGIYKVLYSKDEDIAGVRREFRCSYDIILADDALKEMLKSVVKELKESEDTE